MARLPSSASVAEGTVQAVARGEVGSSGRRRRRAGVSLTPLGTVPGPAPVAGEWWREPRHKALVAHIRALGVDPRRVEYKGPNEIVIHNGRVA